MEVDKSLGLPVGQRAGRLKGAAFSQHLKTKRLPFLWSGTTSRVYSSISAPATLPKRLSKPMSAHQLRLSRALWTSAICMLICQVSDVFAVHMRQRFSPKWGN